jgi:hypothetical protein
MRFAFALGLVAFMSAPIAQAGTISCGDLTGKVYAGKENQGGSPLVGCEHCEINGLITFRDATNLDVVWPSNYTAVPCSYDASSYPTTVTCEPGGAREFYFSEDCSTITWRNFEFYLRSGK